MIKTAAQILAAIDDEDVPRKTGRPRIVDYQGTECMEDDGECEPARARGRCPKHYWKEMRRLKATGEHVPQPRCLSEHPSGAQCVRRPHKMMTEDRHNGPVKSPHRNGDLKWM